MEKTPEKPQEIKKDLTSSNHAFYVGKFIPRTVGEKLAGFLTGEEKSRIYSEEFYLMMLKEAFDRVQPGERVKVVIAPQLSEIFNGESDVRNALDVEGQKRLIRRLSKSYFGREDVEIESVEDQPRHQPFFKALRAAMDPETGQIELEKALADPGEADFSDNPDSLEIARHLYAATRSSDTLKMVFKHAAPEKFKDEIEKNEDSPKGYYAMAEVAIRLADILVGVELHGGAERQDKYDQIIEKIIKGRKGKGGYRNIQELEKIFCLMEGARFNTIHLDTKKNLFAEKRRKFIRNTRRAVGVLLGVTALGAAFQQGIKHEHDKQARIDEMVNGSMEERLKEETFYLDGPHMPLPKEMNVKIFQGIVKSGLKDLEHRYQIPVRYHEDELRPLLQEYLLEHENIGTVHDNAFARFDAVDRFVKRHIFYFQNLGLQIKRPYANLAPYQDVFNKALEQKGDFEYTYTPPKSYPQGQWSAANRELTPPEFEPIGTFASGESYLSEYTFYLRKKDGSEILVATDLPPEIAVKRVFSAEKARKGIRQYLYAMQRYDGLDLGDKRVARRNMKNWADFGIEHDFISPCSGEKREDNLPRRLMPPVKSYEDFQGRFSYEFMETSTYEYDRGAGFDCLLAKAPGEDTFTYERAQEMVERYEEMTDRWIDYYHGRYYETLMPLNTAEIMLEVERASVQAVRWKFALGEKKIPDSIQRNLEALALYYPSQFREMTKKYDGSYKATRNLFESREWFRNAKSQVEYYLESECPNLLLSE